MSTITTDPWSEVMPNLWIGTTEWSPREDLFDAVLTLGHDAAPVPRGMREYKWDLGAMETPEPTTVKTVTDWMVRRWIAGDKCLIRCRNGLDRSGLIAAKVLNTAGATPHEAMQIVRMKRPGAISDKYLRTIA